MQQVAYEGISLGVQKILTIRSPNKGKLRKNEKKHLRKLQFSKKKKFFKTQFLVLETDFF